MSTEADTILVVDDTPANVSLLLDSLGEHGFKVLVANSGERALEQARHRRPHLILLDVMMPGIDGFETCRRVKADPDLADVPVIFMTALSEPDQVVRGFAAGAVDYVTKPFQHEEVLARVTTHLTLQALRAELEAANADLEKRVAERTSDLREALRDVERLKRRLQAENSYLQEEIRREHHNFREIVGTSPALRSVLDQIPAIAAATGTVLILGESGTGKELIARAIHDHSPRRERPLVKVNCCAISAGLVESELFGHVKGAFTGAVADRPGRFELADGGTLFLDEIGELPADTQVKLLRVLQEREFEPVGSGTTKRVDVRVVAATNRNLETEVAEGRFRADLFYRLNVLPLTLPPLRERLEDIPLLTEFFLGRLRRAQGRPDLKIDCAGLSSLRAHAWPGNVRELQNVIERAAVLARNDVLVLDGQAWSAPAASERTTGSSATSASRLPTLAEMEQEHIRAALERTGGVIEGEHGAARVLGLHPNTLRSRMKKLGVQRR